MDKKEVYEHLARIYLDASSKTKRKKKNKHSLFLSRNFLLISSLVALSLVLSASLYLSHRLHRNIDLALVLQLEPVKLNFHFDPAKKEILTIDLKKLNLNRFNGLGFSAKKINTKKAVSLRVEFANSFKEKSEVYVCDIGGKWADYRIDLLRFKNITDWSQMNGLSFIVEEWNAGDKNGIVYIDNVRLLN